MQDFGKKGFIFDLDGTLLDSNRVWAATEQAMLASFGIEIPPDLRATIAPMTVPLACRYIVDRFSLPCNPTELAERWGGGVANAYANEIAEKPAAIAYLHALHRAGKLLAVATSSDARLFEPCLRRLGIDRLFSNITTSDEVGIGKSSPDVYHLAARRLGLDPSDCAVFEDTLIAATTAEKAGYTVVGVYDDTAKESEDMMRAVCTKYIYSYEELM